MLPPNSVRRCSEHGGVLSRIVGRGEVEYARNVVTRGQGLRVDRICERMDVRMPDPKAVEGEKGMPRENDIDWDEVEAVR